MGVSTDGVLFYGFEVGGSEADVDHLNYLRLHDPENERTAEEIEEIASGEDFNEYMNEEYGNAGGALYFLADSSTPTEPEWKGLDLINVCSHDCDQLCLTHNDVKFRARRGCPIEINPADLVCPDHVMEKMRAFCERFRIPWQEPKWLLGGYWG